MRARARIYDDEPMSYIPNRSQRPLKEYKAIVPPTSPLLWAARIVLCYACVHLDELALTLSTNAAKENIQARERLFLRVASFFVEYIELGEMARCCKLRVKRGVRVIKFCKVLRNM